MSQSSIPSLIKFHKQSQQLELAWQNTPVTLSAEFLRVHSPSAEVRGHGVGNEVLQYGKKDVRILKLEPVGNYALKISFDDGHDSGLFNWPYLQELCEQQDQFWQTYLEKLANAGKTRESGMIQFKSVD
ncbi:MAG: DUF971 domain-containing protein [Gammaproteobacteria bacterium]|nr:DUF971 domain-containing protein [Gammaproteobacteria bacterium]